MSTSTGKPHAKMLSEAVNNYMNFQEARRGPDAVDTLKAHLNVSSMFVRVSGDKQVRNVTAQHVADFFGQPLLALFRSVRRSVCSERSGQ